ncbi:putative non-specific serine/threonine protein kinase [Lupinus albus]|uniref:Putative non-specific serine/threonine protein kinase n=1 Tax=Lupinus albus TaxID=3870 RepID=A0A6A4NVC9_LUPAL|nr:putative non-specific serine/threonine protein kinase [Lupinus albus]
MKEEICRVLNIGLMCTSPLPINRPAMRRVGREFLFLGLKIEFIFLPCKVCQHQGHSINKYELVISINT